MTIETHQNVAEHRCSLPARGLIDILPLMPFYPYLANLTTNLISLLQFMIVASSSNAMKCFINASYDEPYLLEEEDPVLSQCDNLNSDTTIHDGCNKPPERRDELVDHHNAVKESDEIWKTNWHEDLTLPKQHCAYRDKFVDMLT